MADKTVSSLLPKSILNCRVCSHSYSCSATDVIAMKMALDVSDDTESGIVSVSIIKSN